MKKTEVNEICADLLLDSLFDGVYYVDLERRIRYWNRAAERITGFSRDEVLGSSCGDSILVHVDSSGNELCGNCPVFATIEDGKQRDITAMVHHKQGFRLPVQIRVSPVRDGQGTIIGAVEMFADNTKAIQVIEQFEKLKHEVYVDTLTGAGNRRYGESMLQTMISEWQRDAVPFGVLFLDVDHFKNVNDTFGHDTGDEVLVMVANTVTHVVRKLDVVARWGGEEFVALLPGANKDTLESMAERIRRMVQQSFFMKRHDKISVTVSIGGTLAMVSDTSVSVIQRADRNMYQSKRNGRNTVTIL